MEREVFIARVVNEHLKENDHTKLNKYTQYTQREVGWYFSKNMETLLLIISKNISLLKHFEKAAVSFF